MSPLDPECADAPDLIAPVIGFRQWRVAGDRLLSITCDEVWRTPSMAARCLVAGHPQEASPAVGCFCGVHAWYEPCPRTASVATQDYVAGAVALWGVIELHAGGMRAQHCRVVALASPLSRWGKRDRVLRLAGRLGVPVVRHRDLRKAAGTHGAPVPRQLRPPRHGSRGAKVPVGVGGLRSLR